MAEEPSIPLNCSRSVSFSPNETSRCSCVPSSSAAAVASAVTTRKSLSGCVCGSSGHGGCASPEEGLGEPGRSCLGSEGKGSGGARAGEASI